MFVIYLSFKIYKGKNVKVLVLRLFKFKKNNLIFVITDEDKKKKLIIQILIFNSIKNSD